MAAMDKLELLRVLENASTSNKQVFGAACLYQYCAAKGLQHCPSVLELIGHLRSISASDNLPGWAAAGAVLRLSGRGDALPADVQSLLTEEEAVEFGMLVECVVEIGIVDMFGERTALPMQFARRTIEMLERAGIQVPDPSVE